MRLLVGSCWILIQRVPKADIISRECPKESLDLEDLGENTTWSDTLQLLVPSNEFDSNLWKIRILCNFRGPSYFRTFMDFHHQSLEQPLSVMQLWSFAEGKKKESQIQEKSWCRCWQPKNRWFFHSITICFDFWDVYWCEWLRFEPFGSWRFLTGGRRLQSPFAWH